MAVANPLSGRDRWSEQYFIPTPASAGLDGSLILRMPDLGRKSEAQETYENFRSKELKEPRLLPGVWYRTPESPPNFSFDSAATYLKDVPFNELVDALPQLAIAMWQAKYVQWVRLVAPGGSWDLKLAVKPESDLRLEYENGGNFYFGATGTIIDNPGWFLNFGAGTVNQIQALLRGNVAPYYGTWTIAFGDDPVDFVYSGMGQDYVNSGQYIWDYLNDARFRFSEYLPYDSFIPQTDNRLSSYDEADRRIFELGLTRDPEIATRMADEQARRLRRYRERVELEQRKAEMLRRIAEEQFRAQQEEAARARAAEEERMKQGAASASAAEEQNRQIERSRREEETRRKNEEQDREASQREWERRETEMERRDRESQRSPSPGQSGSSRGYSVPGSGGSSPDNGGGVDVGGPS